MAVDDVAFGVAWGELCRVLPNWDQVRVTFRRRNGQVLVQVGNVSRTGRTETEAVRAVARSLRERQRA